MSRPNDASVHRCPACGTWLYAARPCLTCAAMWATR